MNDEEETLLSSIIHNRIKNISLVQYQSKSSSQWELLLVKGRQVLFSVVLLLPLIGMQNLSHPVLTHILRADLREFLFRCCSVRKLWSKARCCVLICVSFNTLSQRERVGEMNTDVHTGTMTKAEDNKEEDTATGTNDKPGCCECKFHAFSPTLPLDHMLLARGRSLLSTQQITRTKKYLPKKTANLDSSHSNPYCESESRLLPIVDRQTFLKQTAKTQSNISATRIVYQFPGTIQDKGNDLLANSVISTREIVGNVFLSRDQSLRVTQLPIIRRSTFPPRTWVPDRRTLSQCCE